MPKVCIKCGESKDIDLFPIRMESKDLHRNTCKECYFAANRERKQKKIIAYNATLKEKVCSNKRCSFIGIAQPISNFNQREGAIAYNKRCKTCQEAKRNRAEVKPVEWLSWPKPNYQGDL